MSKKEENCKLIPLSNRVLVKRVESNETMKGGIILPDTAKKKQELAEIIAIGPGKKDSKGNVIAMPVKIGDLILMDKYAGQEVTFEEVEYVIVRSDDIVAIVER